MLWGANFSQLYFRQGFQWIFSVVYTHCLYWIEPWCSLLRVTVLFWVCSVFLFSVFNRNVSSSLRDRGVREHKCCFVATEFRKTTSHGLSLRIHNWGVISAGKFKGVSLVTKHASLKLQWSSDCKTMVSQTGEEHLPAYTSCLLCFLNTAPLPS